MRELLEKTLEHYKRVVESPGYFHVVDSDETAKRAEEMLQEIGRHHFKSMRLEAIRPFLFARLTEDQRKYHQEEGIAAGRIFPVGLSSREEYELTKRGGKDPGIVFALGRKKFDGEEKGFIVAPVKSEDPRNPDVYYFHEMRLPVEEPEYLLPSMSAPTEHRLYYTPERGMGIEELRLHITDMGNYVERGDYPLEALFGREDADALAKALFKVLRHLGIQELRVISRPERIEIGGEVVSTSSGSVTVTAPKVPRRKYILLAKIDPNHQLTRKSEYWELLEKLHHTMAQFLRIMSVERLEEKVSLFQTVLDRLEEIEKTAKNL